MVQHSTFTCDAPDGCDDDLKPEEVATVTITSQAIPGGHVVKHLCRARHEQDFMDGTISGADLFLGDDS